MLSRSALALLLAPALLRAQAADTLAARPISLREAVSLAQRNGPRPSRRAARCATPNRACAPRAPRCSPASTSPGAGEPVRRSVRHAGPARTVSRAAAVELQHRLLVHVQRVRRRPPARRDPSHAGRRRRLRGERGEPAVQRRAPGEDAVLQRARRARVGGRGPGAARAGGGADQGVDRPQSPPGSRPSPIRCAPSFPSATRSSR